MGWGRWVGVAWIAALAGCPADATGTSGGESVGEPTVGAEGSSGPPGDQESEDGVSDTGSSESSAEFCPETHVCIAPAPDGWNGPVALVDQSDTACPTQYPTVEIDAFAVVLGAPAACTCTCDATALCGALIGSDIESACEFPSPVLATTEFARPDACTAIPAIQGDGFHLAFEPDPLAECEPSGTVVVPAPTTGAPLITCGEPELLAGCDDGFVCAPAIADDAIGPCIARTGAHSCPAEYPVARTAWTGMLDERGCSPCECSAADGPPTCDATVRISDVNDCSMPAVSDLAIGAFACVPNDGAPLSYLRYSNVSALVSGCTPSGGTAIGSVSPADPVTICCT